MNLRPPGYEHTRTQPKRAYASRASQFFFADRPEWLMETLVSRPVSPRLGQKSGQKGEPCRTIVARA